MGYLICSIMPPLKPLTTSSANILAGTFLAINGQLQKLESCLNPVHIQQVFWLTLKKKTFFVIGLVFAGGNFTSGSVFAFFWPPLPGPQSIDPFVWLKFFLETRLKFASLEPLNGFLAYL